MRTKTPTPTPAAPMKRANFFMPHEVLDGLNRLADKKGTTAAEQLRRAATAHLKRNGIPTV